VPYFSNAKRERARWMTFEEAIAFVSRTDGCCRKEAERQLRDALGDGKLFIKWEDQRSKEIGPPKDGEGWKDIDGVWHVWAWAQVRFRGDKVSDPFTRRERVLLLLRFEVQRIWPEQPPAPPPEGPRPGAPSYRDKIEKLSGIKPKAKRRGRPDAEVEIHQAIDRLVQRGRDVKDMPRKELVAIIEEECEKKRKPRTILTYISSWLTKHRTDA
jgi:hypothetical protein